MPIVIIRNCLAPVSAYFHPPPSPLGSVSSPDTPEPAPCPDAKPLRLPHPRGCLQELKWRRQQCHEKHRQRYRPYARRKGKEGKEEEPAEDEERSLAERVIMALEEALYSQASWDGGQG